MRTPPEWGTDASPQELILNCRLIVLLGILGCSEYNINEQKEPVVRPDDGVDSGLIDDDTDQPIVDTGEVADAFVYANTSTSLYEVEPETGARSFIGDFHDDQGDVTHFVDIAIDMQGRMFGGTFDALYRINPLDARVTRVCTTSEQMTAMAFSPNGDLFIGGDTRVQKLDIATCSVTPLVDDTYETSGDLVGLPDGYLYWTVRGIDGDELVRIDPETGATVWVGPVVHPRLYGLGYAGSQLYGFSAEGLTLRISPVGAASSVLSNDEDMSWWGATTNPVTW